MQALILPLPLPLNSIAVQGRISLHLNSCLRVTHAAPSPGCTGRKPPMLQRQSSPPQVAMWRVTQQDSFPCQSEDVPGVRGETVAQTLPPTPRCQSCHQFPRGSCGRARFLHMWPGHGWLWLHTASSRSLKSGGGDASRAGKASQLKIEASAGSSRRRWRHTVQSCFQVHWRNDTRRGASRPLLQVWLGSPSLCPI